MCSSDLVEPWLLRIAGNTCRDLLRRRRTSTLPIAGGRPSFVHRFATEHDFPGLGIAPDGRQVAFTAPAADGYFQIFHAGWLLCDESVVTCTGSPPPIGMVA